jgi:RNA polymerase primary sigma factor
MKSIRITGKITKRENESFKHYLDEISNIKMFTPEEEAECAIKASNGNKSAIDEMVKRNLRFVVSIAKQYESPVAPLEDLINEGNIGLIMAVKQFKANTGFKFITYAVFWIRKYIMEYLDKNSRLVRLPSNKINSLSKYNQKVTQLEQQNGGSVYASEIIDKLDSMSEKEIMELENISTMKFDSLDEYIGDGDSKSSLYELISDDSIKPTDDLTLQQDLKNKINLALETLKPRDREIMVNLFGLNGKTPLTLKEVGEEIGLTREMIRQIKEKSLIKIKKSLVLQHFS